MDTDHRSDRVEHALAHAREQVERTHRALDGTLDPRLAYAAVEGVHHLASAVAGLVGALMEQVPAMAAEYDTDPASARELVADLRAMHGCLTTGVLLLDPALEDLRGLATNTTEGTTMRPDAPEGDWADQQVPIAPDGEDALAEDTAAADVAASLDADPADVAEQQRTVPHDEDPVPG